MKLNKSTFIRWKIHIDRSRMYLGYIQFFMIGIVFFKTFKDKPFGAMIFKYAFISIPVLFLAFIFFSILLGYLESKLGLKEEEKKTNLFKSGVDGIIQRYKGDKKRIDKA